MRTNALRDWLKGHLYLLVLIVFVFIDLVLLSALLRSHHDTLRVTFLDVGQGDAVFIESPSGNQMLYDAGPPSGAVLRELAHVMPFWDRSIDVAVFSHPDMDHIGGFVDVLDRYKVDLQLEPGSHSENGVYDADERAVQKEGAAHFIAHQGMTIDLGGGVKADVLYPDHDMSSAETNSSSIVLRIRYGTTAFLLSGDLPQEEENYVVSLYGDGLHANVLKAGHHGSRTSSSPLWLTAVHPDTFVISAGKDNHYGHPHKEVLELLDTMHIPKLITFEEGDITFESDGSTVVRK